jgi:ABC-2 type transport system permease protein
MLGGCMWPLSIVSKTMREVGHIAPQAWAVDAWTSLLSRGGSIVSIAPELGVLAAFAAGFLTLATVRLRRVIA